MMYLFIIVLLLYLSNYYDGRRALPNLKNNKSFFFVLFLFIVLAGLSKGIGGDVTNTYWPEYDKVPTIGNLTLDHIVNPGNHEGSNYKYKPLYIITRSICKSICDDFWVYHIFHALFINLVIFFFVKKRTPYLYLTLAYYFVTNYFEFNTEIIRESLALTCGLLAYNQFENKKYFLYLFFCVSACMFHTSGIIVFLMPIAHYLNKVPRKYVLLFFIGLTIVMPIIYERTDFTSIVRLLGDADQRQQTRIIQELDPAANTNFYIFHYFRFFIFPIILIALTPKKMKFPYMGFIYIFFLFRLLSMYGIMFYRFANYYAPFLWMFMAFSSFNIAPKIFSKNRFEVVLLIFLLFFILQNYYLIGADYDSGLGKYIYERYIPYKSVIFN